MTRLLGGKDEIVVERQKAKTSLHSPIKFKMSLRVCSIALRWPYLHFASKKNTIGVIAFEVKKVSRV